MELVTPGLTNLIAWLAIVAGVLFAVWWAIGLSAIRTRQQEEAGQSIDGPDGIREKLAPVPAVLLIFIIFTSVAMISYILSVWLTGVSY